MEKKILISSVLLSVLLPAFAQQIEPDKFVLNLQPDSLIHNLLATNNFDKETELSEIRNLYKLSFWHFAPGISYDFIRQRTYLTINTSALVSHFVSKKMETRRIGAIERKYKAKEIGDQLRIQNLIRAIEKDHSDLILAKKVVDIEIDIFLIQQQQYKQNEIDTEKYLTSKKNIINAIKLHNSSVTNLIKQILNLSSICNSPVSADLDHLYFTLDFIDN